MEKRPIQLYLSCNLLALSRQLQLRGALQAAAVVFEDVSVSGVDPYGTGEPSHYFRLGVQHNMVSADWFLVMADRYEGTPYHRWVEWELNCAYMLHIPVLVLQPWSCWSVAEIMKKYASQIVNWPPPVTRWSSLLVPERRQPPAYSGKLAG